MRLYWARLKDSLNRSLALSCVICSLLHNNGLYTFRNNLSHLSGVKTWVSCKRYAALYDNDTAPKLISIFRLTGEHARARRHTHTGTHTHARTHTI